MKAVVIHEFGDVDVLKYGDIETPIPRPGHVLIKVLATGVNRFDCYRKCNATGFARNNMGFLGA